MFCYSETGGHTKGFVDLSRADAVKNYLIHYGNSKTLRFIINKSQDFGDRRQATRELEICERKMLFWSKHNNFESASVGTAKQKIDKMWQGR